MREIVLIAAMGDVCRTIGRYGKIPWKLKTDIQMFKQVTLGHTVIMGHTTFQSIGRPLVGRQNIVMSRQSEIDIPGCFIASSVENALDGARTEVVYVIGGEQIYSLFLPLASRILLTLVHGKFDGDAHFPLLPYPEWRKIKEDPHSLSPDDSHYFTFTEWVRDD